MNKNIIISNLKKDHFRITEKYGEFILGDEYETIKRGRCISIDEHLSPDELVSSAKAFIEEMNTVLNSFSEFVNEFFTSSKPEMYDHSSEVWNIFKIEMITFLKSSFTYVNEKSEKIKYEEFVEINNIPIEVRKCLEEFNNTESRLNKYIDITTEISKVNNEKDDMSFSDIIKGTNTIMDHLVDVVDEYTLNTFNNEQLMSLKDACMLQIKNSQNFVNIGASSDLDEEDKENIQHLKGSAMRLAMMVKQIDLFIS